MQPIIETAPDVIGITDTLLKLLMQKSELLHKHSLKVGFLAKKVSEAAGFSEEMVEDMRIAGLLHDIGKLTVPNEILHKPALLTEKEWEIMKAHSEAGANLIDGLISSGTVTNAILHHHERNDGNGYPFGLTGDQIHVEAKIIKVCDVFAAVTSKRPYKPTYSKADAIRFSLEDVSIEQNIRTAVADTFNSLM